MPIDSSLIDFLLNPSSYPEQPEKIEHFETHISHVFVGDRFAYKIKKPVDFGFLDFTSLQKRRFFCFQEVLVNTELAGEVYLGVRPIYARDGEYAFAGKKGSKVVEYAVRMKRLPAELILSTLINNGDLLYRRLESVGRRLSRFHRDASPYKGRAYGGLKSVMTNTEENFEQIKPFLGTIIDSELYRRLTGYTRDFIESNQLLFRERKQQGSVRDGHGDLHAQHICLSRPPIILDRIEFSKRFRISDVLEDIGFLLMDLDFRGRFDLSASIFASYFRDERGRYDEGLLRFYKIYRAVVRAKIEGFSFLTLEEEADKSAAGRRAAEYYSLAEYYLDQVYALFNPVVFLGISGSGKSAIAKNLLAGAIHLQSDEIRKRLTGTSPQEHVYVGYQSAIYDRQTTDRVYRVLHERAVEIARSGRRVIIDATYGSAVHRRELFAACVKNRLNPFFVHCFATPEVLRKRISRRMKDGGNVSDAHIAVVEEQIRSAEEPKELPFFRVMHLNTEERLDRIKKSLRSFL